MIFEVPSIILVSYLIVLQSDYSDVVESSYHVLNIFVSYYNEDG